MRIGRMARVCGGSATILPLLMAQAEAQPIAEGFLVSDLSGVFYRGEEKSDCPEGRSLSLRESYLQSRPPADRERLLKPENAAELDRGYKQDYVFGKDGRDICTDPELFDTPDHPLQKPFRGPIAPGMDLDGAAPGQTAAGTCAHDGFTSPSGESGVDNQMFRVTGCNTMWRGAGDSGKGEMAGPMDMGANPVAIAVADVDDWRNDPHVEVLVGAVADRPVLDSKRTPMAGSSATLTADPRYRVTVAGRIKDGVLMTEAANLIVPYSWVGASGGELILRHMRLRLTRTQSGELTGMIAGYRPIDNVIAMFRVGGPGTASTAGVDCASLRRSLRAMADGDLEPQTRQCSSVSSAMNMTARPAYIFDAGRLLNSTR